MSGIGSNIVPFVSTVGFGGIAGFLVGFALKRIMKILAVIAGVFFAALGYLESQHIVNINLDNLQTISNNILSTITTNVTSTSGGGGVGTIQAFLGNNNSTINNNYYYNNNNNNNNYSRWCEHCNRMHPLDKDGKRKCPEMKVGMDYEDKPGYYEREDFDSEAKF